MVGKEEEREVLKENIEQEGKVTGQDIYSFENLPELNNLVSIKFWNGLIRSDKIKAPELRLYFVIYTLRYCQEIHPSRQYLAEKCGRCSKDKIDNNIQKLCDIGLLEKLEQRRNDNGYFSSNNYRLADIKQWLQENNLLVESWCGVWQQIITFPYLTDNECRFYMVLRSWGGKEELELSLAKLVKWNNCDKKTLLNTRKSLIEKGLIRYERRGSTFEGNQENEYFITDEEDWLHNIYKIK